MVADTTQWDALLKENYSDDAIKERIYLASTTWARARKRTNFFGKRKIVPVKYAHNQGIGPTVAIAKANVGNLEAVDFIVSRKKQFGLSRLDRELLKVAKVDKHAFLEATDEEINGTTKGLVHRLCMQLHRNGGGAIGKLDGSCNVATPNLVLNNVADAKNFKPGMVLQADTTDGTSGAVEAGTVTVSAVDQATGAITLTGNGTAGIGTLTNVMYLFPQGMFGIGASGLDAWNPATVTSAAFNGVDRSVEPVLLAGNRKTASGSTVEDALIDAAMFFTQWGDFDTVILDNAKAATLLRELGSKAVYMPGDSSDGTMGLKKLMLNIPTGKGSIEVMVDAYQPTDCARFVRWDCFSIDSADQAPHIQRDEKTGYIAFPVDGEDQVEVRQAAYWNVIVTDPSGLARLAW